MKALSFETFSATDRPWSSEGVSSDMTVVPLVARYRNAKHVNPGVLLLPAIKLTFRLSKCCGTPRHEHFLHAPTTAYSTILRSTRGGSKSAPSNSCGRDSS